MSNPDFEAENFTDDEIATLVHDAATEDGINIELTGASITAARAKGAGSTEAAIKASLKGQNYWLTKGLAWGARLAEWATIRPEFPGGVKRPVLGAMSILLRGCHADYPGSIRSMRVDPSTGVLIEK
jgi:hypothetical protein